MGSLYARRAVYIPSTAIGMILQGDYPKTGDDLEKISRWLLGWFQRGGEVKVENPELGLVYVFYRLRVFHNGKELHPVEDILHFQLAREGEVRHGDGPCQTALELVIASRINEGMDAPGARIKILPPVTKAKIEVQGGSIILMKTCADREPVGDVADIPKAVSKITWELLEDFMNHDIDDLEQILIEAVMDAEIRRLARRLVWTAHNPKVNQTRRYFDQYIWIDGGRIDVSTITSVDARDPNAVNILARVLSRAARIYSARNRLAELASGREL